MYFSIIVGTIWDTRYFMVMIGVILLSFSMALLIISKKQETYWADEITPVWNEPSRGPDDPKGY
jgi:cell shape-determining protein MreD